MDAINIIIPKRMKGERLDAVLAKMMPDFSRSKITTAIKSGDALINGKTFKPKEKSTGSEIITFNFSQKRIMTGFPKRFL